MKIELIGGPWGGEWVDAKVDKHGIPHEHLALPRPLDPKRAAIEKADDPSDRNGYREIRYKLIKICCSDSSERYEYQYQDR